MFNRYHSETEMLRYLRSLVDKDLALDRTMIPLGSCTMKLNATTEMIPVTWPEFAHIHPFAPADQTVGYREMIDQLEAMLVRRDRATPASPCSRTPARKANMPGLLIIHAVPRVARRRPPQRLPDSRVGARHQPGVGAAWPACRSSSSRATPTATSTSPT